MKQKYTTCVIMDPEMAVYKNSMRITRGIAPMVSAL